MTFKEWFQTKPSWLKGGIIGFIIPWVVFIILIFSFIFVEKQQLDVHWTAIIGIPLYLFISVISFGIGSIIGLIIGKIKSKK